MKKFVQPDPATGYRFTKYRIKTVADDHNLWPFTEEGYIYHKIDLSDVAEPYLSAIKRTIAAEESERNAQ